MDINQRRVDESYQSSSHSQRETDSSTMNLRLSRCDLSKENKELNLVNQVSDKSINGNFPNLLFEIKKLRTRNPS